MAAKKKEDFVLRAGDIGWGYTKYTHPTENGEIEFRSFPSLAPRASLHDMSMGLLGKRDTVTVNVEGTLYEVGPDSSDLVSDSTRNLNEQYIYTDQYKALFYGILSYMGDDEIDLLVLGLPVSGLNLIEDLRNLSIGKHQITKDKEVEVKDVLILPQPLGALYYCMSQSEVDERFEFLDEEVNLIIDPGFLTFDFLTANGKRTVENRSGAHPGGVSKILRAIANSISEKHKIKYEDLNAIDKALSRRRLKVNGKKEDLGEHIKNTRSEIEGSVNYMKNMIGDGSNIDNIIVVGGGSEVFKKTIEGFYSNHEIIFVEDPQMANVKGYYQAGLDYLKVK
jgi:plasmid segregation protein ParM